jgi:RNA polymerase sigma factor (sigma-70 family)
MYALENGLSYSAGVFPSQDDAYLVALAKSGNQQAFIALVERHSRAILRTALRITKNQEDAEDVVQDAFTSAYVHLQNFDGRSQFSTWLTRIAINGALMVLRKRRNRSEVSTHPSAEESHGPIAQFAEKGPGPELYCIRKQRSTHLHDAISRLRPNLRKVVEIQLAFECSVENVADQMGLSVPATKSRLMRARKTLQMSMARRRQV